MKKVQPVGNNPKKTRREPSVGIAKGPVKLHKGKGK